MGDIPTRSRQIVSERDNRQCRRCGCPGNQYHHRRGRRVGGHDPHCPCNAVTLCTTCHSWAHSHGEQARELGFIVSRSEEEPWTVPYQLWGNQWAVNSCDGGLDFVYDWVAGDPGEPPRRLAASR